MILLGAWVLAVIFGIYFGHGLIQQLGEHRARLRWYVWESDSARRYILRDENPTDYWFSIGVQGFCLCICIGVALRVAYE